MAGVEGCLGPALFRRGDACSKCCVYSQHGYSQHGYSQHGYSQPPPPRPPTPQAGNPRKRRAHEGASYQKTSRTHDKTACCSVLLAPLVIPLISSRDRHQARTTASHPGAGHPRVPTAAALPGVHTTAGQSRSLKPNRKAAGHHQNPRPQTKPESHPISLASRENPMETLFGKKHPRRPPRL